MRRTTYKFQRCLYIFPGIRALRVQLIKFKGVPFGSEGSFLSSAGINSDKIQAYINVHQIYHYLSKNSLTGL